jgi:hypothetical protein
LPPPFGKLKSLAPNHSPTRLIWGFLVVFLSQDWLPTVQLVLHADWQEDLHSPQPLSLCMMFILGVATGMMCLMASSKKQWAC